MTKQIQPEFLYSKFLQGECTPEELAALFHYFGMADEKTLRELIGSELEALEEAVATEEEKRKMAALKELIDARNRPAGAKHSYRLWSWIGVAASILFILSVGSYYLLYQSKHVQQVVQVHDITPGKNTATLTLANGQKIILSAAIKGKLAEQAGVSVNKTADGKLVYTVNDESKETNKFNTLATARGEQYQVILPDGTHVWLNAASSIRFPTVFTGHERNVELTGEAYFEVAKNRKMPFKVKFKDQEVEVLGTHFDIKAYGDDEDSKTTLLEGSVKIYKNNVKQLIVPGEQAISYVSAKGFTIQHPNLQEVVAWKNGFFMFHDVTIQSVMKQVSRWYDVDVIFQGDIADNGYSGSISKYKNISELLKNLELAGTIRFKIDGRRVIVMQ